MNFFIFRVTLLLMIGTTICSEGAEESNIIKNN